MAHGKKKKPIFQMDKTCRYYDIELYKDTSAVVKPFRIESEPKFDWEALAGRPHARMICCGVTAKPSSWLIHAFLGG